MAVGHPIVVVPHSSGAPHSSSPHSSGAPHSSPHAAAGLCAGWIAASQPTAAPRSRSSLPSSRGGSAPLCAATASQVPPAPQLPRVAPQLPYICPTSAPRLLPVPRAAPHPHFLSLPHNSSFCPTSCRDDTARRSGFCHRGPQWGGGQGAFLADREVEHRAAATPETAIPDGSGVRRGAVGQ